MGAGRALGRLFFCLRGQADEEWLFTDGSYIRAHQHASGARHGFERAIGRSRGGLTTKIHMVTDSLGNPLCFEITGGEVHDSKVADKLIESAGTDGSCFIADKGYDSEEIREEVRKKDMTPVIPRRSNSNKANPEFDSYLYRLRHLVENAFARIKHFRSIATRFEKLKRNYQAMVSIACSVIYLRLDSK